MMSVKHPVPNEAALRQILAMLYGDELTLAPANAVPAENGSKSVVAVYVNDDNEPVTACVCNHEFVAFAGSALTRIPPGGAEDAAESGDFSEMMLSNHHEVMNICSRLFMSGDSPHLRLEKIYISPDQVPENARTVIQSSGLRADFNVQVPGYGAGSLSFLVT